MMKVEKPNRVPLLGGWINSDTIYQDISGVTEETFWENSTKYALQVYRSLSIDGLVGLAVPSGKGLYRGGMTKESFYSYKQRFNSPEDVLVYVESLPSKEEALKNFDAQTWRENLVQSIKGMQEKVGDMVWMPTLWNEVNPIIT